MGGTIKCHTIGGMPTPAPISMSLAPPRSLGSFSDAIAPTGPPTSQSPAQDMQSLKYPYRWPTNGGCDFAADPSLGADRASIVWLPHIDPTTVFVEPAPDDARSAK